jgi:hypothetical protein
MNLRYLMISLAFLIFATLVSCDDESKETPTPTSGKSDITGSLIGHTDCKSFRSSGNDTFSQVKYIYDSNQKKLLLKHINTGFNCCPENLFGQISISGDSIIISESEKSALCNCLCLYDMNFEVNGVLAKEYVIKIIEPYAKNLPALIFKVDFSQAPAGDYYVIRKNYPWGM